MGLGGGQNFDFVDAFLGECEVLVLTNSILFFCGVGWSCSQILISYLNT